MSTTDLPVTVEAPFLGTPLAVAPVAATSHLRLHGKRDSYHLVVAHRTHSTVTGKRTRPSMQLEDGAAVVWQDGRRLMGLDEHLVWCALAYGTPVTVDEARHVATDVLTAANTGTLGGPA